MNLTPEKDEVSRANIPVSIDRSLTFQHYRDSESIRAIEAEWSALYRLANGEYFQSFEYCYNSLMCEHIGTRRKPHCVVARRNGKLVAVWPLLVSYRSCWKFAEALTPQNRSPSDILVAPENDAQSIVDAVFKETVRATRADVFELWRIRKASPLYACVTRQAVIRREEEDPTPYAALRSVQDWESFSRSRSGREKTKPEYLKRRLAKDGQFTVELIDASDPRLESFIEWFVVQKRKWATEKVGESLWTFSDASLSFWKALLSGPAAASGIFRLFVMTFNGEPVAANIVSWNRDTFYLIAITYDMNLKKYSPGTILVDECVKWAFEDNLDFDFGPGEQRYKTSWSGGESYPTSSFMALATPWGQTGYMTKQFVKQTRERAMRVVHRVVRKAEAPATRENE
ncbi:GNAT family N-acetyltransferase [Caballeronia sp. LZ062]|uniref:GNAT family N-acetyltransferase n=1 Tax=unclassified Caballeronia TaxID=2646786 RepID=UPI00285A0EFA|nr:MULTISPECIES: GNAT family N-acetyltransferase [unclassified Caballeronia]MDR5857119.1 GNAT family N-acetyltransferase [Caballeronia sp. LZ050]MDR5869485.1 GNAT family N-acetyltransferase [Caballeronia sp. LZ062]